jgi:hypothetical protein
LTKHPTNVAFGRAVCGAIVVVVLVVSAVMDDVGTVEADNAPQSVRRLYEFHCNFSLLVSGIESYK